MNILQTITDSIAIKRYYPEGLHSIISGGSEILQNEFVNAINNLTRIEEC